MILASPTLSNSYWYIGHLISILISSNDTQGAFSVIHGYEIQGLEPPPHIHTQEEESFYLLDGEMEFTIGDELHRVSKGDWIMLPRNIPHTFRVISEKAEVIIHLCPGGFEEYFIAMSEPAGALEIPPRPQGPPNIQKLVETASRYGIVFPMSNKQ